MLSRTAFLSFRPWFLLLWPTTGRATLTNITVDDTNGTYWTWAGSWNAITPQTPCTECFAQPDAAKAYNRTWHDGSLHSGSFTFQGAAVYIYGIEVIDPANVSFGMSNPSISTFHFDPPASGYVYNALFFHATGLDSAVQHTVTWVLEPNAIGGGSALFDYAIVTLEQTDAVSSGSGSSSSSSPSTSSPISSSTAATSPSASPPPSASKSHKSNAGAIAGGVVGAIVVIALLASLAFCVQRKSRHGSTPPDNFEPKYTPLTAPTRASPATHYRVEAFQMPGSSVAMGSTNATASSPSLVSATPVMAPQRRSKEPLTVLGWNAQQGSDNISTRNARDLNVEERLRNLEAMAYQPPAY
ncbi:hypothetical protein GGX14DRAFT_655423 [Mycena pura]|uniref:Uncharacterized protein n=1 Tax=Mycena pura TaxID=153505 RepID=A0AAD6V2V8_9AGAR|nr:hypothetical protein GGX14DRAFT_655423 [Mycena pura]